MGNPERMGPFSSLAAEHSREGLALTGNGCRPQNGTNSGSGSGPMPGRVRVVTVAFCVWGFCESHSGVCDFLQPHGLHSPWRSPGQNTGIHSLSLPQGIFPNQGSSPGPLQRRILSDRAAREALKKRKKKVQSSQHQQPSSLSPGF